MNPRAWFNASEEVFSNKRDTRGSPGSRQKSLFETVDEVSRPAPPWLLDPHVVLVRGKLQYINRRLISMSARRPVYLRLVR